MHPSKDITLHAWPIAHPVRVIWTLTLLQLLKILLPLVILSWKWWNRWSCIRLGTIHHGFLLHTPWLRSIYSPPLSWSLVTPLQLLLSFHLWIILPWWWCSQRWLLLLLLHWRVLILCLLGLRPRTRRWLWWLWWLRVHTTIDHCSLLWSESMSSCQSSSGPWSSIVILYHARELRMKTGLLLECLEGWHHISIWGLLLQGRLGWAIDRLLWAWGRMERCWSKWVSRVFWCR